MKKFDIQPTETVNSVTIDWVRLSVNYQMFPEFAAWLGIPGDGWDEMNRFNKQNGIYLMDGVAVYADDLPRLVDEDDPTKGYELLGTGTGEKRFIVDWSGSGLGHWHKARGDAPLDILRRARELAQNDGALVRVQRLDIAFDDFEGYLDMNKIERYLRSTPYVVTRWEKFERTSACKIRGQSDEEVEDTGETIYLGSRVSNSFARIYDKLKEVKSKLNREARRAVAKENALPAHWVRFELELKRKHAQAVADGMLNADDPSEYAMGVLRGKIDFKATSGDSRIRRRDAVRWWKKFTLSCAAVPIRIPRPVLTLARIMAWVGHAVAPSLATLWLAAGGEGEGESLLREIVRKGEVRLDKVKRGLLNEPALNVAVGMAHGM